MRQVIAVIMIATLLFAGLITFLLVNSFSGSNISKKSFYFGVSFCGETVEEARLLIDRVRNYTNLFVLQSGLLQDYSEALTEICDYAVSNGMYCMVYFDHRHQDAMESWLASSGGRWGSQFLGVYYHDEPAGNMLDHGLNMEFTDEEDNSSISIMNQGGGRWSIAYRKPGYNIFYEPGSPFEPEGYIFTQQDIVVDGITHSLNVNYYPNGTLYGRYDGQIIDFEAGGDAYPVESYEALLQKRPLQTFDEAARLFTGHNEKLALLDNKTVTMFTSDYVLYWFDYLAGYDVVLAQLGWNNTLAQEIGLVRGAANIQGKSWGTIITWTYTNEPYLASGDVLYEQMRSSYECGAEYVVVFNYAGDMQSPYGILQDEHFLAMERFWSEVVQNPEVVYGGIEAEAVFVLPHNYGWGMRNPNDVIWGLWSPDDESENIWELLRDNLAQYGSRLDIVYNDANFPVAGKYSQICYWNQTV